MMQQYKLIATYGFAIFSMFFGSNTMDSFFIFFYSYGMEIFSLVWMDFFNTRICMAASSRFLGTMYMEYGCNSML